MGEAQWQPAAAGTALYVHFPFCSAKCSYCDFYSLPAAGHDLEGALQALFREAASRAPASPRTVFLGGGTPSLYSSKDLRRFLDRLDHLTGFRESAREVTVECNPESLDEYKAEALMEAGVNRFSIGVQSLRPRILEWFGRVHSKDQGLAAIRSARRAGATRLSADMIYSIPGQSLEEWTEDLTEVLGLGLEHLSAYNLTFEPETALYRQQSQGKVTRLDEEQELEFFVTTRRICGEHGLQAYEISNFAAEGQECQHNLNYWANGDYVGIGPSAVSHTHGVRFGNPRSLTAWRQAIESDLPATSWNERSHGLHKLAESWWLGLRRRSGVSPTEACGTAGLMPDSPEAEQVLALAHSLIELGLLESHGARIRLTERGWPLADGVARRFLEGFTT